MSDITAEMVAAHGLTVYLEDAGARRAWQDGGNPMQIDRRLRLVANRAFGVAKALPYRDDDEGKQHGVEDADNCEFEPGHLGVQAKPVHAVEAPRQKH